MSPLMVLLLAILAANLCAANRCFTCDGICDCLLNPQTFEKCHHHSHCYTVKLNDGQIIKKGCATDCLNQETYGQPCEMCRGKLCNSEEPQFPTKVTQRCFNTVRRSMGDGASVPSRSDNDFGGGATVNGGGSNSGFGDGANVNGGGSGFGGGATVDSGSGFGRGASFVSKKSRHYVRHTLRNDGRTNNGESGFGDGANANGGDSGFVGGASVNGGANGFGGGIDSGSGFGGGAFWDSKRSHHSARHTPRRNEGGYAAPEPNQQDVEGVYNSPMQNDNEEPAQNSQSKSSVNEFGGGASISGNDFGGGATLNDDGNYQQPESSQGFGKGVNMENKKTRHSARNTPQRNDRFGQGVVLQPQPNERAGQGVFVDKSAIPMQNNGQSQPAFGEATRMKPQADFGQGAQVNGGGSRIVGIVTSISTLSIIAFFGFVIL